MDAVVRGQLRRLVDRECRRRLGAQLDERGRTGLQGIAHGHTALSLAAFEATGGDPLLALTLAVDAVRAKQAAAA